MKLPKGDIGFTGLAHSGHRSTTDHLSSTALAQCLRSMEDTITTTIIAAITGSVSISFRIPTLTSTTTDFTHSGIVQPGELDGAETYAISIPADTQACNERKMWRIGSAVKLVTVIAGLFAGAAEFPTDLI